MSNSKPNIGFLADLDGALVTMMIDACKAMALRQKWPKTVDEYLEWSGDDSMYTLNHKQCCPEDCIDEMVRDDFDQYSPKDAAFFVRVIQCHKTLHHISKEFGLEAHSVALATLYDVIQLIGLPALYQTLEDSGQNYFRDRRFAADLGL
ncbi:hypothetical protein CWC48_30080 [Pseudomonas sp. S10E 269]|uniref:hypothetical protein n=1 Tax=Pseudomonas sp. S10E 269 TaxID=2054917 RepID=UPI000C26A32F|nr:hypothetical protein [Pseudomonas sp. S10E 269]PJK37535.1 hypothetical protein CWC48_29855 [Pseudomonas sp. S10E 269]PJK37580.1 hypothetical protein CWC48_30080 [Pseudomonas sp. S10E 269]